MSVMLKKVIRFILALYVLPKNIGLYLYGPRTRRGDVIIDNLYREGFYVYPDLLPDEDIQLLKDDHERLLSSNQVENIGQLAGRIYDDKAISPLVNKYVEFFSPIAEDYFNYKNIDCELTMYQKSIRQDDMLNIPGGEFHMDDNKKNLKFFIYLTSVTIKNGPFTYLAKSHGIFNVKKILKWFLWEITHKRKFLYASDTENKIMRVKAIPVLGGSGTILCADTTGYHAASQVIEGERLVMVVSFSEKRFNPYALVKGPDRCAYQ